MGFSRLVIASLPVILAMAGNALAALPDGRLHGNMRQPPALPKVPVPLTAPVTSRNGTVLPPYNTTYYFDQLIDHNNPSLGTFKQRFWHTWEFYEPGGPIIITTPGEANAEGYSGYLTNRTINGLIAQQQNGSTIVLEHRFYGLSNPKPDLSSESLKLHTIDQAVEDLVYFANNVKLPQPNGDQITPDKAPWVLIGGSYSGALTAWTMVDKPGVFYAGYASSAVVEAILDFWQYFEPIRVNMPQNCSADVQAVISHIDKVFTSGDKQAIQNIKNNFGLGDMSHLDDVAGALRNNLWDWQSLQPTSGAATQFRQFCDALEVRNGVSAPASGWGVDHALAAWGAYWVNGYFRRLCGSSSAEDCLGTYNASQSYWTDTSIDNVGRSWFWIVCNEVGYLQDGAPVNRPSLVTRLVQPEYDFRQCHYMFPSAFPEPPKTIDVERTNAKYKGFNVKVDRLFFANGVRDPWKEATMSAEGLNVESTPLQPIVMADGFHCSDLSAITGAADASIGALQKQALALMKEWLATWTPAAKKQGPPQGAKSVPVTEALPEPVDRTNKPINAWLRGFGTF